MADSLQLSQRFMLVRGVATRDWDSFDSVLPQPMARGYANVTPKPEAVNQVRSLPIE
jgi:hypothetical protein